MLLVIYYIRIKLSEDLFIDVKGFDSLTGPVQANYEPLKEAVPFYGLATRIESDWPIKPLTITSRKASVNQGIETFS